MDATGKTKLNYFLLRNTLVMCFKPATLTKNTNIACAVFVRFISVDWLGLYITEDMLVL